MDTAGTLSHCASFQEAQEKAPNGASLAGWITADEREWMMDLFKAMQPGQVFLEIGIYGASSLNLCGLTALPGVRIIGIDDFSNDTEMNIHGRPLIHLAMDNLRDSELSHEFLYELAGIEKPQENTVRVIALSSHEVGPRWNIPLDLVRIDGDHTYEGALMDFQQYLPWVVRDGLACIDNYTDIYDVRRAFDEWLAAEPKHRWRIEHCYGDPAVGSMLRLKRQT